MSRTLPLWRSPGRLTLILGVVVFAAACDIPTDVPDFDQRWIFPGDETSISVNELLPSGVGVASGGSAFTVQVSTASFSQTLGGFCPQCSVANGLVVPKPAFSGIIEESVNLPGDVASATVSSGSVTVTAVNGFTFDPLRPGAGNTGTLTMTLTDANSGSILDQVQMSGTTDAFSPGSQLSRTLSLVGTIGSSIVATVLIDSPAGDAVLINTSEALDIEAVPGTLLVSSARVDVSGRAVDIDDVSMDVDDIDDLIVERVGTGALVVNITNPFGIGITANILISGSGFSTISKSLNVSSASSSTERLEFSSAELRSFLGKADVMLGGTGQVLSSAGVITVTPGLTAELSADLDILFNPAS